MKSDRVRAPHYLLRGRKLARVRRPCVFVFPLLLLGRGQQIRGHIPPSQQGEGSRRSQEEGCICSVAGVNSRNVAQSPNL